MNNYKYLSKFLLIFFAFIVIIFTTGCETTEPPERKPESVREYTWEIDTLNIPDAYQNLMRSVWASGPNDIYICGHNSGSQIYEGNGNMWHYDGNEWRVVDIRNSAGWNGNLITVHGSSADNIWAVGYNGRFDIELQRDIQYPFILQLENGKAKRHIVDTKHAVYGVFVESETSVWACGDGGLVYHYDGNDWEVDTIEIELLENQVFQLSSIVVAGNSVYVRGIQVIDDGAEITNYFFSLEKGDWAEKDQFTNSSQVENNKFGPWLYKSDSNEIYSYGIGGVYEWKNTNWENIFNHPSYGISSMSKNSEENILITGFGGDVFHYNGTNWLELENLRDESVQYTGVLIFAEDAYIIGNSISGNQAKTFVLHGK